MRSHYWPIPPRTAASVTNSTAKQNPQPPAAMPDSIPNGRLESTRQEQAARPSPRPSQESRTTRSTRRRQQPSFTAVDAQSQPNPSPPPEAAQPAQRPRSTVSPAAQGRAAPAMATTTEDTVQVRLEEEELFIGDEWLQNLDLGWQGAVEVDPTPSLSTIPDDQLQGSSLTPAELVRLEQRSLTLDSLPPPRKACSCPEHEHLYDDWPSQNAEIVIGTCMKLCPYCGYRHEKATEIRKHIKQVHFRRNILVRKQRTGERCIQPGWGAIPAVAASNTQSTATDTQA